MRPYGANCFLGSTSDSLDTKCVSEIYNIVSKSMSYNRYGEILFRKVVLGYELPFVHPGSSKNVLTHYFLHKYIENLYFSKINNQRQQRGTRGSSRCNIPAKPRRGEFGHILRFFDILGRKWAHGGPGGVLKGPWRP